MREITALRCALLFDVDEVPDAMYLLKFEDRTEQINMLHKSFLITCGLRKRERKRPGVQLGIATRLSPSTSLDLSAAATPSVLISLLSVLLPLILLSMPLLSLLSIPVLMFSLFLNLQLCFHYSASYSSYFIYIPFFTLYYFSKM